MRFGPPIPLLHVLGVPVGLKRPLWLVGAILGPATPEMGSNTSITIVYPAQLMLPDDHGSLVVTSICLQSHAHMVILSLWVMA